MGVMGAGLPLAVANSAKRPTELLKPESAHWSRLNFFIELPWFGQTSVKSGV